MGILLRSLSSFSLGRSVFSVSFRLVRLASLPVSLLSPPWRLFLELESLSRDGIPKLNTEGVLFVLAAEKGEMLGSLVERGKRGYDVVEPGVTPEVMDSSGELAESWSGYWGVVPRQFIGAVTWTTWRDVHHRNPRPVPGGRV